MARWGGAAGPAIRAGDAGGAGFKAPPNRSAECPQRGADDGALVGAARRSSIAKRAQPEALDSARVPIRDHEEQDLDRQQHDRRAAAAHQE